MKVAISILTIVLLCTCKPKITPAALINEAIDSIAVYSIYKNSLNVNEIRRRSLAQLEDTVKLSAAYPVIHNILNNLNDNHSRFINPKLFKKWKSILSFESRINFRTDIVNDNIGYIFIPHFTSGNRNKLKKYAQDLQHSIINLGNKHNIKAWIIDLRMNFGGNCWPMITGLGPILGEGTHGYFLDADSIIHAISYKNGTAKEGNKVMLKIGTPVQLRNNNLPIAVLTGPKTASSSELLTILFLGKQHVRTIGETTAGLTTGNKTIKLSDGSALFLTSSFFLDCNNSKYEIGIFPDLNYLRYKSDFANPGKDDLVKIAIDRFEKQ